MVLGGDDEPAYYDEKDMNSLVIESMSEVEADGMLIENCKTEKLEAVPVSGQED